MEQTSYKDTDIKTVAHYQTNSEILRFTCSLQASSPAEISMKTKERKVWFNCLGQENIHD